MRLLTIACLLILSPLAIGDDASSKIAHKKQPHTKLGPSVYKVEMQIVEVRNATGADSALKKVDWDSWRKHRNANLLSSPTLVVAANKLAAIELWPTEPIQYLEPDGNKRFVLKEFGPHKLGLKVSALIDDAGTAKIAFSSATLDGGTDGTQVIVGVDVPIGKPVVRETTLETKVKFVDNQPVRISLPTPRGKHAYMLLRVSKR